MSWGRIVYEIGTCIELKRNIVCLWFKYFCLNQCIHECMNTDVKLLAMIAVFWNSLFVFFKYMHDFVIGHIMKWCNSSCLRVNNGVDEMLLLNISFDI